MLLFQITLFFTFPFSIVGDDSCSDDKDALMLKCKFDELNRHVKEIKEEMKKLKMKQTIDMKQLRVQHEFEISNLQLIQEEQLDKITRKQITKLNQLEHEVSYLKNISIRQDVTIMTMKQERASWSTYCQLLPIGVCGSCMCVDDDLLLEKYYCDCMHVPARRDCLEHYHDGFRINGLYKIHMNILKVIRVYCDQTSDGGGWTVIQRRVNGDLNFYRNWGVYKIGFGSLQREFYLGNENLYLMSLQAAYPAGTELRVDMRDWNETELYAKYDTFQLDSEMLNYTLHVGGFSGNCGDSLTYHSGMQFSTYDRDNDEDYRACSTVFRGAWWYKSCHYSNLNGIYRWKDEDQPFARCIVWYTFRGYEYSLKSVEMKVRRKTSKTSGIFQRIKDDKMGPTRDMQTDKISMDKDKHLTQTEKLEIQEDKLAINSDRIAMQEKKLLRNNNKLAIQADELMRNKDKLKMQANKLSMNEKEMIKNEHSFAMVRTNDKQLSSDGVAVMSEKDMSNHDVVLNNGNNQIANDAVVYHDHQYVNDRMLSGEKLQAENEGEIII